MNLKIHADCRSLALLRVDGIPSLHLPVQKMNPRGTWQPRILHVDLENKVRLPLASFLRCCASSTSFTFLLVPLIVFSALCHPVCAD